MGKLLRNIGFGVIVIALTAVIFFIVVENKKVKRDVLEYSLDLLGSKLFSMVPESADKKALKEKYDKFMQQAVQREVPPEQIEVVAANILNVSNMDTILTLEQAEAVLNLSLETPLQIKLENGEWIESKGEKGSAALAPIPRAPKKQIAHETWDSLGERLSSMYQFNENIQEIIRENIERQRDLRQHMQYRFDSGLRLALDEKLRTRFDRREFRRLTRDLKRLEEKELLEWRENFAEEMKAQMEQMRQELKSLKELKQLHQLQGLHRLEALKSLESLERLESLKTIPISLKALQNLETLKSLESLKSLEALKHIEVPDADSIRKAVEKSLEEAGIEPCGEKRK